MIRSLSIALLAALPTFGSAQTPVRPVETPKTEQQKPTSRPSKDKVDSKPGKTAENTPAKAGEAKPAAGKPGETPVVKSETDVVGLGTPDQLPAGLDPADIAAIKSAPDMLRAERRLKQLLKEGKIKDIDRILTFEEISSWPYEDGLTGMPKAVKKLDGTKVMMTGFMLPIDEVEGIKEFLLVQSLWSCCYGQPPDINGIVRVVMKGKSRIDYQFDPIKIIGDFKVEAAYEDGYCLDIYQLHAESVEAIK